MTIRPDWPTQADLDKLPPGPPPIRVRISQSVSQSFCGCTTHPIYPEAAKKAHIQGSVVILGHMSKDGAIENLYVEEGNPMLAQAALEAVSHWQYRPYLLNGQPVAVETQIVVNFTLQQ